jgi:hypothetical protein
LGSALRQIWLGHWVSMARPVFRVMDQVKAHHLHGLEMRYLSRQGKGMEGLVVAEASKEESGKYDARLRFVQANL